MDRDKRWERTREGLRRARRRRKRAYACATASEALAPPTRAARPTSSSLPTLVGEPRPVARRRRGDLLQLPPRSRAPADARVLATRLRAFPVHRFDDFIFATMTKYEENFPNPVLFGPRPQSRHLRRNRRARRADAASPRRDREIRARDVLLQRRPRGGIRARRPHPDPVEPAVATYDLAPEMRAARSRRRGRRRSRPRHTT